MVLDLDEILQYDANILLRLLIVKKVDQRHAISIFIIYL
jgi:hypothetical protein